MSTGSGCRVQGSGFRVKGLETSKTRPGPAATTWSIGTPYVAPHLPWPNAKKRQNFGAGKGKAGRMLKWFLK